MFEAQRTGWHGDAREREPLRERVLVADEPDGGARGAEIDDASPFDPFEKRRQDVVGLGGYDKSRVNGRECMIKRIEGVPGRHSIESDHAAGESERHPVIEYDSDILSGSMEVFHEATQHAAALGQQTRVEGPAGEATAAEVFVDQNPHGAPRKPVWLSSDKVCSEFPV
jgi:hypothetical protein